ncbi:MAG TPA: SurA N-terminal domain-containing protein [Methylibium sp.]|uniref:SurA N-terminal domain-containing protein n=1 Tax=Methylibium sp. TaxID=2067992 RepID=UPI002DBC1817|nr:SurA N-terminal domain-containing protein [Methylibium sp.]HEU4460189.1 SurA N-terminal domain-containing protein [Methylibium sp.]
MFEFVRSHTRLLQFVLVLLVFPAFVFVGVEGYRGFGQSDPKVATVAGRPITQAEWDNAQRTQLERARAQSPGADAALLDTPAARQQTLDALIRDRVLLAAADKLRFNVSDERLQRVFANDPQLAFLRNPDGSLNRDLLIAQGMNPQQFEQQLRQDLAMRQVLMGIGGTALAPAAATDAALDALFQQREVRIARFESKNYASKVAPTDAQIEAYYQDPANAASFNAPERADIEYLVLDLEAVKAGIKPSDEDLRKFYDDNMARFVAPEERRASHILVKSDKSEPADKRAAAKAKAQSLLDQARKDPKSFAELARKNSDDPGSAAKGGDLDFFGRGAMVKPFEDAAFSMKTGDIGEVVESDFGYHVILLTGVRGGEKKPFDAVKTEIAEELKTQQAQKKFAELAETFTNMVYEQADSFKPTAEKLGLAVQTAKDVVRTPAAGASEVLANAKFLAAVFSEDSVKNRRNTEAVDLGASRLASARVLDHSPARRLPLEAVKDRVKAQLVTEQAAALARKDAEAKLEAWRGGASAEAALEPALKINRAQSEGLPRPLIEAVLAAPAEPLPSWTIVDFGELGSAVVRVDKVLPRDPSLGDPKQLATQYAQVWGAAEAEAYYAALKERFKVQKMPPAARSPAP